MTATPTTDTATEAFLASRNEWKAAGCPANHPYLQHCAEALATTAAPIQPLVVLR